MFVGEGQIYAPPCLFNAQAVGLDGLGNLIIDMHQGKMVIWVRSYD